MQEVKYKKNKNKIILTGEISELPEFTRNVYVEKDRSLVQFTIKSYREKTNRNKQEYDEIDIVLFDHPDFLQNAKVGDRFQFVGELQNRNYGLRHENENVDEIYQNAVNMYRKIVGSNPTKVQYSQNKLSPVIWEELFKYYLIPSVPKDSMYDINNQKTNQKFVYSVDIDGTVIKETQHVHYEVLVHEYRKLTEPLDKRRGDKNKVTFCGHVNKNLNIQKQYRNKIPYASIPIQSDVTYFSPNRKVTVHAIAWDKLALDIAKNIKKNDYVEMYGRFQTRKYTKEMIKKRKSKTGKRQQNKIYRELHACEISISGISKCILNNVEE